MKKKSIIAFVDGRPGHEKQTFGIIAALREAVEIDLRTVRVDKCGLWKTVQQFLLLSSPFPPKHLAFDDQNVDLIIGTGSSTHLPMLLCKKKSGAPVVTCMTPNILLRKFFDLCFVPEHDGLTERGNIRLTLGAPNLAKNSNLHQKNYGLIAVGGRDEKSHLWESDTVVAQIENIVRREMEIFWTITSSPRTPDETVAGLRELSQRYENCEFFDFNETEPGWIEEQYGRNYYVWVTSDSISMIFEALSSGCKVGILPMRWKKKGKFQRNEKILKNNKFVVTYNEWLSGSEDWPVGQRLDESQKCARLIQTLWQTKN